MQRVLLIIGGGIAAYKAPELVRQLRAQGLAVRCLLTAAAEQFVSPLSLASVSGDKVYENLFDLTEEAEMGHIQLSRDADIILVAPATADLMAKAAQGMANDLASTTLLATDKKIIMAPAMNVRMWQHEATQRNLAQLRKDGVSIIGPEDGDMACGEFGPGRMSEPQDIAAETAALLAPSDAPAVAADLTGRKILVTAGPTHEPIDPVRYIANRSSGKQGYAIAAALAAAGAEVHLISGPTALDAPHGVQMTRVETARDMQAAVEAHLPVDAAVMTAAVADWRPAECKAQKIKKGQKIKDKERAPAPLDLVENPDILATLGAAKKNRPALLVGFAAETEDLETHALAKLQKKNCDWIVANNVALDSGIEGGVMGGDANAVTLISTKDAKAVIERFDIMSKHAVAALLATRMAAHFIPIEKTGNKGKAK
ncbi:MAG: bifunctional phosphopantothenoylcysteine decarboxylase/phosphopantothenate--cysteine ligase CoaBC [PS1 clade bacterium]|nr:bifunctional phosphopantothenoylcysteine decarboxylase/phosphopantothenate--cysteine ligase CoaBC [PS1 clade bacterium]MBL6783776.1 bifunctional phosphopantothenoylcysteine decarboxylase/phosphopantothenate--cysteine ligase CoaBC [PS1 clade bacterium]